MADDAHDPDQKADNPDGDAELEHGPGDGGHENTTAFDLTVVVVGQLGEDFAESAGLVAHLGQFAEQDREEITGRGQGLGQTPTFGDRVADLAASPPQRRSSRPAGLPLPHGPNVDPRLQRRGQPSAQPSQFLRFDSRVEKHGGAEVGR